MDVTKPYKFIGFGPMDVTKPYKFKGFGAMDATKPYKSIGFGPKRADHFYSTGSWGFVRRGLCWSSAGPLAQEMLGGTHDQCSQNGF